MEKTTIVTALYDIGRGENDWGPFTRSFDDYLEWMQCMLVIDNPMVIFTEEKAAKKIVEMRSIADPSMEKTKIIVKDFKYLPVEQLWGDKIRNIISSDSFRKQITNPVPELLKPQYNILVNNKFYFVDIVIEKGWFPADYYMWLDAGGLRGELPNGDFPYETKWPSIKTTKPIFVSYKNFTESIDLKKHCMEVNHYTHGTVMVFPKDKFKEWFNKFYFTLDSLLKEGYVASDEKIYNYIISLNPSLCNIYVTDYRNYFKPFINYKEAS